MNRPAVRNVRAMRIERELARARRDHAKARERRKQAASHRAIVACALLGAFLGVLLVAAVTELPAWLAILPAVGLGASMTAGHRASLAASDADRAERRRIDDLARELSLATGKITPAIPASQKEHDAAAHLGEEAPAVAPHLPQAEQVQVMEEAETAQAESEDVPTVAETRDAQEVSGSQVAEALQGAGDAQVSEATAEAAASKNQEKPEETVQTAAPAVRVATVAPTAPKAQVREATVASRAPEPAARGVRVAGPSTPPQGWRPVHVPAPTYTLVGSAPRRAVPELEEVAAPSAPVPQRPTAVRTFSADVDVQTPRQPIDLDAVLQKRRAAGA